MILRDCDLEAARANLAHHLAHLEGLADRLEEESRALTRRARDVRLTAHQARGFAKLLGLDLEPEPGPDPRD